jgi:ribonuclease HI
MIEIYTDGGSRGNPGKAACAFVVYENQNLKYQEYFYLGTTTNNQAEYSGLLKALKYLVQSNIFEAKFYSDSELMVKQIHKLYKVKEPSILKIYNEVMGEICKFKKFEIFHVRREKNKVADLLVNKCLDEN